MKCAALDILIQLITSGDLTSGDLTSGDLTYFLTMIFFLLFEKDLKLFEKWGSNRSRTPDQ